MNDLFFITFLNLSLHAKGENSFSGSIPSEIEKLDKLERLNLREFSHVAEK